MKKIQEFVALVANAFMIILLYISLEFIFLLSKVSYFSRLTLGEYAKLFLNSSCLLLIPIALFLSFIYLICIGLSRQGKVINLIKQLFIFIFSFSFIFLVFSHLDTLIYTSFYPINIAYLPLPIRIFIFLCLLALSLVFLRSYLFSIFEFFCSKTKTLIIIFNITLILGVIFLYQNLRQYSNLDIKVNRQSNEKLPNIILFSSDGLQRERMSVYGASRDTTPNLREFAKSAIIFTQAYSNTDHTRGSITSILTGKSPATTKVFGEGEILMGKDSFEHLPAILRKLGYYCASFGLFNEAGPVSTNMLNSFDEVNGFKTYLGSRNCFLNKLIKTYPQEAYFLRELFLNRVYHKLICLGLMNKFLVNVGDREKTDWADRIIKQPNNNPTFIQIHLNDTHSLVYYRTRIPKKYSSGKKCAKGDNDCYDDALLYMDKLFGDLLHNLKQSGKYGQTITLFITDHGRHERAEKDAIILPLIIRFPNINVTSCDYPVQHLDIAPSILKAINVNIPDWMEGWPILYPLHNFTDEQINSRPIFCFNPEFVYNNKEKIWKRREVRPPLYGLQEVCMAVDRYFLELALPSFDSHLFVLENFRHIPIINNNKRREYLYTLSEYLKNKGFVLKR